MLLVYNNINAFKFKYKVTINFNILLGTPSSQAKQRWAECIFLCHFYIQGRYQQVSHESLFGFFWGGGCFEPISSVKRPLIENQVTTGQCYLRLLCILIYCTYEVNWKPLFDDWYLQCIHFGYMGHGVFPHNAHI